MSGGEHPAEWPASVDPLVGGTVVLPVVQGQSAELTAPDGMTRSLHGLLVSGEGRGHADRARV
jgi:hypothetical protein